MSQTTSQVETVPATQETSPIFTKNHAIPVFTDKYTERKWAKAHMAGAFRMLAKFGWNDGAGGHISLRDPVQPDCFWINPYSKHFGSITVSDLILVTEEGVALTPTKYRVNKAGFMIHSALHKARPDINAAIHTHSPYGRAWSAFGRPIEMLNQDSCYFYNDLAVYEQFGALCMLQRRARILQLVWVQRRRILFSKIMASLIVGRIMSTGATIGEAVGVFTALEQACEAQLLVEAAAANGIPKKLIDDETAQYTKTNGGGPEVLYMQFVPEYDMILEETNGSFLK
ncbi:L-fuculose-phosphate aldolase [Penicillium chermesinum]|uniref:L-fuculose-phosphate aldolase n=1 Tax=Penicillium chermesinum TaxID=63820 RepID=A0A9W9TK87_9EURO|nr:L-fuculose-phosphate aldolase [Penicillium chermesinum]KAJ5225902.1 L-fuculose-phosphate aldolase [Penicillium chermesinum]